MQRITAAKEVSVDLRNINVTFRTPTSSIQAINNLSLQITSGEFVCLIGPSGSGKSTILHLVAGFIGATGGQVSFKGAPVIGPGTDRGIVFQEFLLFPWMTVSDNIGAGMRFARMPRKHVHERVGYLLDQIGLREFEHSYPTALSGGMQQRVALARMLANKPDLLLMDEPFGALDAQTRQVMQRLLLKIWETEKQTILFVTHDVDEAILLADRIILLTKRPARVQSVFDVSIPRPRGDDIFKDQQYIETKLRINMEIGPIVR